ncbi:unnamed protein product, partial [marine sediment metagenome]
LVLTPVKIKPEQPAQKTEQNQSMSYINSIEYSVSQDTLEIEVLTDHFLNFNTFELSSPDRIILDISGIDDINCGRRFEIGESPVQEIRLGMFKSDTARVVFYVGPGSHSYSVVKTQLGLKVIFVTN